MIDLRFGSSVSHPIFTFTRASDAWQRLTDDANGERWESIGGNDRPRITRVGGNAYRPAWLIEPARTNRCLQSAALFTAPWVHDFDSTTPDASVAPDGNTTGDRGNDTQAGSARNTHQFGLGFANSDVVSISIFAKCVTSPRCQLSFFDGSVYGAIDSTALTTWKRLFATGTIAVTASAPVIFSAASDPAAAPPTVATTGTADGWGGQAELGWWASSPVPAVVAIVTRAADVGFFALANTGGRILSPGRGRVGMDLTTLFANGDEPTGRQGWVGLDGANELAWDGTAQRLVVRQPVGDRVVLPVTYSTGDRLQAVWTWTGTRTQLSVLKNGAMHANGEGTWDPTAVTIDNTYIGASDGGSGQFGMALHSLQLGY